MTHKKELHHEFGERFMDFAWHLLQVGLGWIILELMMNLSTQALKNRDNIAVRDSHLRHLPIVCVRKASMYLQNCCIYIFMQYLARRGKEGFEDFRLDMFKKETDELTNITSWVRVRTSIKKYNKGLFFPYY